MPCERIPGGYACTRGHRQLCGVPQCRRASTALCDHQLEAYAVGRTCDMRLCDLHRVPTGPDTDLCPAHARQAREAAAAKETR